MIQELNKKLKTAILDRNIGLKRAIRNIKTDFIYETGTNHLSSLDTIIKLYNKRISTMKCYKDIKNDLYEEEKAEMMILKEYLPVPPLFAELCIWFDSLNIEKKRYNFRKLKDKFIEKYGYTPDSEMINCYIENEIYNQ